MHKLLFIDLDRVSSGADKANNAVAREHKIRGFFHPSTIAECSRPPGYQASSFRDSNGGVRLTFPVFCSSYHHAGAWRHRLTFVNHFAYRVEINVLTLYVQHVYVNPFT